MNAVPISSRSPAANGQNSVVIFDRAELNVVLAWRAGALRKWVIFHLATIYQELRNFTIGDTESFTLPESNESSAD